MAGRRGEAAAMKGACMLDACRRWYRGLNRIEWSAVVVWGAALVVICCRVLLSSPGTHSEYPVFAGAARNWLAGNDLYGPAFDPYRYSPLVAALLVPLGVLPDRLGSILWRSLNAGVYLGALHWWSGWAVPYRLNRYQRALMFLLVAPLSIGNVNSGQSNPLMLGMLLAASAALAAERWSLGSACVALACLLKVYPIAAGLLLVSVCPLHFAARFAAALAGGMLLPFLMQRPAYVAAQYAAWGHRLLSEPRYGLMELSYIDLRVLFRAWVVPLGSHTYLALQLLAAVGIATLCVLARRSRWPRLQLLNFALALSCCWMTVFGLSTESTTYILLAPPLAYALLEAWEEHQSKWKRTALLCSYGLLLATQLAGWIPGMALPVSRLGPQPLAGLLFLGCLVLTMSRRLRVGPVDFAKRDLLKGARHHGT